MSGPLPEGVPRRGVRRYSDGKSRCAWCGADALMIAYHDREWGRATRNDRLLFEMLCLEGAQAGLSWSTILRRRASYRRAYDGFDARKIARYGRAKQAALLKDPGIIRNHLKIDAFVANAQAYLALTAEFGSFSKYLRGFTPFGVARRVRAGPLPASTPASDALSHDLKTRGFRFVGSTICYAFMQAVGLVDDHFPGCFRAARGGASRRRSGTRTAGSRARR
jgi:DNA-3-methyladenine glycosylase I